MRIGQLIILLSEVYGLQVATTTLVARALREAGLLTTGARGVNAPEMGMRDVARLTLALLTGEPPSKVVEELRFVGSMQTGTAFPVAGFISKDHLADGHTLEDAVIAIFTALSDDERVVRFSTPVLAKFVNPPGVEITLDASKRVAQIEVPGHTAEYTNLLGLSKLDELYATRPMTLDVWEQIQAIEEGSALSFDSSGSVASRGMRVVRSITGQEIKMICDGIQGSGASVTM